MLTGEGDAEEEGVPGQLTLVRWFVEEGSEEGEEEEPGSVASAGEQLQQ